MGAGRGLTGETPPGQTLCWSRTCWPRVAYGCQGMQAQTPRLDPQASSSGRLSQEHSVLPCHPHLPLPRWARAPGSLRERPGGCARVHDPPGAGRHHSQRTGRPAPAAPTRPAPPGQLLQAVGGSQVLACLQRLRKWSGVSLPSSAEIGGPGGTGLLLRKASA